MAVGVELSVDPHLEIEEVGELYGSVGWKAYTSDLDGLWRAIANSTYVVAARSEGELIGLARALSDDVSVCYLQDLLVRPSWQRRGVGRLLLENCLARFDGVRTNVLLTDDRDAQHRFYESMGYTDIAKLDEVQLHAFVKIEGFDSTAGD